MISDEFLHPDHVIPPVKLVSTLFKASHHAVSEVLVKPDAVLVQIRILPARGRNTGLRIPDSLKPKSLLQCFV